MKSHVDTEHKEEDSAPDDKDEQSVICGQCGLVFSDETQCNNHMTVFYDACKYQ